MRRYISFTCVALASYALDRLLAAQLFETNVVAGLLSPSSATAPAGAVLALLFLTNRVWLYVALPSLGFALLAHAVGARWQRPLVSERRPGKPRAPTGSALP